MIEAKILFNEPLLSSAKKIIKVRSGEIKSGISGEGSKAMVIILIY